MDTISFYKIGLLQNIYLNKKKFHIALNAYLPSLLTGLKANGIDPNQFLKTPYLKKLDLYDPDKYIPSILLDDLLVSITNKLRVDCLASDFNEHFKTTKMGCVSNHLFKSPNFLCFLENVIRYSKIVKSNYTGTLETLGPVSKFSVKINGAQSKGKLISEEIDICRILDAFMLIGGENFVPIELGVTAKSSYHLESIFPKGDYSIQLNQEESWIRFDTAMLSKKIPSLLGDPILIETVKENQVIEFRIERLLESFKPGYIPRLDELSQMLDVSRRTLERKLQDEGTHFLTIKKRFLQRKSYELLNNTNLSVKEIAEQLNYSNSQNFSRSFGSWNGVSPEAYRLRL